MEPTIAARFISYAMDSQGKVLSTRDVLPSMNLEGAEGPAGGDSKRATSRYSPTNVMHRQLEAGSVAHNLYNL